MLSNLPFKIPPYLLERTRGIKPIRVAVAGAGHPLALESARQAANAGLINPVLIGDRETIVATATDIGWDISDFEIVDVDSEDQTSAAAVALAKSGEVTALMKGHIHTDSLIKAAVNRDNGLRTGRRLSHIFHMTVPNSDRVLFITDGAVNVAPDTAAKIDIINNAVKIAHALGNAEPRVAILSGTESIIPSLPSSVDAAKVTKRASNGEVVGAIVEGPLAFDNALSPEAAAMKGLSGPVAGNTDILVVPNIETGNSLFKMMVYFMSGLAAGVVMGAKVPIVLTSRADPPEARFAATAIAAIIANTG